MATSIRALGEARVGLRERIGTLPRVSTWRWPQGAALWRLIWRIVWLPYWVASDVPAPQTPAWDRRPPAAVGPAGDQVVHMLRELTRRIWIQRILNVIVRSAWLGIAVGCFWLLLELSGGPALDFEQLIGIAIVLVALGVVFAVLVRPTRLQIARMLDRSFGLRERMTTAVGNLGRDVPKDGARASVVYLQMADAANVIAELRDYRAFRVSLPVREIVLGIAWAVLFAALFFFRGVGGDIPALSANPVPPFTPAAERIAEEQAAAAAAAEMDELLTTEEVQERARRSNEAQRDLQTLSQALQDHPVTRSAADAIQRGDYDAAADQLRDLAQHADELSAEAREGLANDLDQAASRMSPGGESLANASRSAAEGLREGDQAAQEGVHQLGDEVERTGQEVVPQQELADQMRQAQDIEGSRATASRDGSNQQSDGAQGDPASDPEAQGQQQGEAGMPGDAEQSGQSQASAPQDDDHGGAPGSDPSLGDQGEGNQPGEQAGAPGEGEQPGGPPGAEGFDPMLDGNLPFGEADQAQQGPGAGGGESEAMLGDPGAFQDDGQMGGEGAPAEQQVTDGSESSPGQDANGQQTTEAVELPRTSGEGVRTSDDGGSSTIGSGAGVTARGGDGVQGEVGVTGPDSNRVPPSYRALVERYFSDPTERR